MNVLLINGSPHAHGCTDAALQEIAKALNADGIETTIYHIGAVPVGGCVGCGGCAQSQTHAYSAGQSLMFCRWWKRPTALCLVLRYIIPPPLPACWASCTGWATAQAVCWHKSPPLLLPAPAAPAPPRTGSPGKGSQLLPDAADQLHLLGRWYTAATPNRPPWTKKGMQIMRNLGHNMAWILKCIAAGKAAGIEPPKAENTIRTNFIR